jgi:hypothetical protein
LTDKIYSLNPIVNFEWENSKPTCVIKWQHINDQSAEKYILILDKKEIYYVFLIIDFLLLSMKYSIGKSTIIFA